VKRRVGVVQAGLPEAVGVGSYQPDATWRADMVPYLLIIIMFGNSGGGTGNVTGIEFSSQNNCEAAAGSVGNLLDQRSPQAPDSLFCVPK
jgi:hypothetical protein